MSTPRSNGWLLRLLLGREARTGTKREKKKEREKQEKEGELEVIRIERVSLSDCETAEGVLSLDLFVSDLRSPLALINNN